jgi:hypothetical protein
MYPLLLGVYDQYRRAASTREDLREILELLQSLFMALELQERQGNDAKGRPDQSSVAIASLRCKTRAESRFRRGWSRGLICRGRSC